MNVTSPNMTLPVNHLLDAVHDSGLDFLQTIELPGIQVDSLHIFEGKHLSGRIQAISRSNISVVVLQLDLIFNFVHKNAILSMRCASGKIISPRCSSRQCPWNILRLSSVES